jgi:hypothetical protein
VSTKLLSRTSLGFAAAGVLVGLRGSASHSPPVVYLAIVLLVIATVLSAVVRLRERAENNPDD